MGDEMRKRAHATTESIFRHRTGGITVMKSAEMATPVTKARVIEFPHVQRIEELEAKIESRLQELTEVVDGFGDTAFNLFLTEKSAVREAIQELVVKVSALDWIVRVAKRSTGSVRAGLWSDIERALADLERTAQYVIRATENWAHLEPNDRNEHVICMDRF